MHLLSSVENHATKCSSPLFMKKHRYRGHVFEFVLACDKSHEMHCSTSSKIGDNYAANFRIHLAFVTSGMLKTQYTKFTKIGNLGTTSCSQFSKIENTIKAAIDVEVMISTSEALHEELTLTKPEKGIRIETDARHAQRKNSFHTDVVALGMKSHKVLNIQNICKTDDSCSQRHELIGTRRLYEHFDKLNVPVLEHSHDRNLSVNKMLRHERKNTHNSNDRWHVAKAIGKEVAAIGRGSQKNHGVTWHRELGDKSAATRNHFYWSMEHCNGDAEKLRELLINIVPHFQNDHAKCYETSRCKENNYAMKTKIIENPVAANLLKTFIQKSNVYKNPSDYVFARDTYFVESFNNTCVVYVDKRVRYGVSNYRMRTSIAVLDWNSHAAGVNVDCNMKVKRPYANKKFEYVERIWKNVIQSNLVSG